jgi:nucleotide-binding universal stress UspA family protein
MPAQEARRDSFWRTSSRSGTTRVTALFSVRSDVSGVAFAYSAGAALNAIEESGLPAEVEREHLRKLLSEHEPECAWCEVAGDSIVHGFVAEAAYADLLILGQPRQRDESGGPPGFVESVILQSGTPAVVVPHPYRQKALGERVLIAWNGSPQSARALNAALPLLQRATEVHVASWARQPPMAPFSRLGVQGWLQRHGIASRIHHRDLVSRVADELTALAEELGADLVVMGCYGHSRIRERVFGGVTRELLANLPVPILAAH